MVGFQGIILSVVTLMIFGGVIFNSMTFGAKCIGSVGKDCNDLIKTLGGTIISADTKIGDSVIGLKELQTKTELTQEEKSYASFLRNQIYFGILSFAIFFFVIFKGFKAVFKSQEMTTGGQVLMLLVIGLTLAIAQVAYTVAFEGRVVIPYSGFINLAFNPGVLADIVDDAEILPGNLTTQQLTQASNQTLSLPSNPNPSPTQNATSPNIY